MAGTDVLVFSIQSTSHLILQSQRKEFPRRSLGDQQEQEQICRFKSQSSNHPSSFFHFFYPVIKHTRSNQTVLSSNLSREHVRSNLSACQDFTRTDLWGCQGVWRDLWAAAADCCLRETCEVRDDSNIVWYVVKSTVCCRVQNVYNLAISIYYVKQQMLLQATKYSQMGQRFEPPKGVFWQSLDVIILNEPEERWKQSRHTDGNSWNPESVVQAQTRKAEKMQMQQLLKLQ